MHSIRKMKEEDVPKEFRAPFACDAVIGACMMTRKDVFLSLGGFDEVHLPIAYNDVEYCLRARRAGYAVVCQSEAKLFHYESKSRTNDFLARFLRPSHPLVSRTRHSPSGRGRRYREFLRERGFLEQSVKSIKSKVRKVGVGKGGGGGNERQKTRDKRDKRQGAGGRMNEK